MQGYKLTNKGDSLLKLYTDIEPNLELSPDLDHLVGVLGSLFPEKNECSYDPEEDKYVRPLSVRILERRGYIERSIIPEIEDWLVYKKLLRRI